MKLSHSAIFAVRRFVRERRRWCAWLVWSLLLTTLASALLGFAIKWSPEFRWKHGDFTADVFAAYILLAAVVAVCAVPAMPEDDFD